MFQLLSSSESDIENFSDENEYSSDESEYSSDESGSSDDQIDGRYSRF